MDIATRKAWDPSLKIIEKLGDDTLKLTYQHANDFSNYTETVKYSFVLDKEGNHYI
jgi:hypothetical protein